MDKENGYWVWYLNHTKPTYVIDGNGQRQQRENSLQSVKSWRNAVDVGSNVGEWTRPLAKRFKQVICFEPNPNFRKCFQMNINEDDVVLHPYALSTHSHQAEQGFNHTHLNFMIGDTEPRRGNIECRSLDSFNLTDVDYIKIDVDGFEVPMLLGAEKTLRTNNPVINIEMKEDKRPETIKRARKILWKYGYQKQNRVKSDEVWLKS